MKPGFFFSAVFLFGAATGWFIRGWSTPRSSSAEDARESRAVSSQSEPSEPKNHRSIDLLLESGAFEHEKLFAVALYDPRQSKTSFAAQFDQLGENEGTHLRREAASVLARKWFAEDPAGAFQHCVTSSLELRNVQGRSFFHTLIELWSKHDLDAALVALRALPDGHTIKDGGLRKLIDTVAVSDISRALEIMRAHDLVLQKVFSELAKTDVPAALAEIEKIPSRGDRRYPLEAVVVEWARKDAAAAIAHVASLDEDTGSFADQIASVVAKSGLADGLQLLDRLPADQVEALGLEERFAVAFAKKHPNEALAFVEILGDGAAKTDYLRRLASVFADERQYDLAARALLANEDTGKYADRVFVGWASRDWDAAAKTALEIEFPDVQRKAVKGLLGGLPYSNIQDSPKLDEWAAVMIDLAADLGDVQSNTMGSLLQKLQPETLLALNEKHPELVGGSIPSVLGEMAAHDPDGALKVFSQLDPSEEKFVATTHLASNWAQNDGPSAASWVESLPAGKGRDVAFANVANNWARAEPDAAREWLEQMAPSPARSAAIGEFVRVRAGQNPQAALDLASTLKDSDSRAEALSDVFKNWIHSDLAAATKAIAESELPTPVIERLRETIEAESALQALVGKP